MCQVGTSGNGYSFQLDKRDAAGSYPFASEHHKLANMAVGTRRLMTDVFCGDVSGFWTHINLPKLEISAKTGPNYCPRWSDLRAQQF
jgi:hypothetical protein